MKNPKSRRTFLQLTISAAAAYLAGCERSKQTVVTITGASTLLPVIERAARAVEERHPEYRFEVSAGGTDKGIRDVMSGYGYSQLGMVARPLTPEEIAKFQVFAVGTDGVAVVVHATNPIVSISREQLRAIHTKQITDWESLTGRKGRIETITKGPGHGARPVYARYLGLSEAELKGIVAGNNAEVIAKIHRLPEALGFVSLGEALTAIKKGEPLKLLTLDGVAPTPTHVADETYPARLDLTLISMGEPSAGARLLIDFMGTAEGKQITADCFYVPAK